MHSRRTLKEYRVFSVKLHCSHLDGYVDPLNDYGTKPVGQAKTLNFEDQFN